ncbi:hypothetical protein GH714_022067 [Hevea brasiliensis]|uniref:Major facilitator superfamily (MFS) profile domain-containing protein n=1 Tax=Hevea brasiliensis TaxID=3981 RepID=A0A6A6LBH8_HEVBR|nr:hypothetical protein GH714_022067 [Hevea brasiliensis]
MATTPLMEDVTVDGSVDYKSRPAHRSSSGGWRSASFIIVAVGQGGHKPCVQAFGADQFNALDPKESGAKRSFFNWWYFSFSAGINLSLIVVVYIQENLNWVLGFGIPCIVMLAALLVFLLGSRTYRYSIKGNEQNPFIRIGRVIVRAARNWRSAPLGLAAEEETYMCDQSSEQFKFLNKALLAPDSIMEGQEKCRVGDVNETKALLRLIPIWATSLAYAIVFSQTTTFFTKQGVTMDRTIFTGFKIPAASLQTFIGFAIILFIPIYDRIFVPLARSLTGNPSGITMLQRIGTGMIVSALSMAIAALVEKKRLNGMVDEPNATIPMSIWWLVPQYVLCGVADVFTIVGLQEFFYDQVPEGLRSVGLSLYLSVIGVGNFLSSFLVSVIDKATVLNLLGIRTFEGQAQSLSPYFELDWTGPKLAIQIAGLVRLAVKFAGDCSEEWWLRRKNKAQFEKEKVKQMSRRHGCNTIEPDARALEWMEHRRPRSSWEESKAGGEDLELAKSV